MKFKILIALLIPIICFSQPEGGADANSTWTFPGSVTYVHSMGRMWISTPGTFAISTGGIFQKIAGGDIVYSADHLQNFHENTDGRLTYIGSITREYSVSAFATIESGEVTQLVMIEIAEGGVVIASSDQAISFTAVNFHSPISTKAVVELETNEYIELWITSDQNGDNVIIHNVLVIVEEHP